MGDRRQHSWLDCVERWTSRMMPSSRSPADAPLAGKAASMLLSRLEDESTHRGGRRD